MTEIGIYISQYNGDKRKILTEMYDIIKSLIPQETKEKISWEMPTFYLNGNLVHFAMQKNHIGLYPGASGVANFEDELKEYKHSKGAIQFPLNKPLPKELISKIVKFRISEQTKSEVEGGLV